MGDEVKETAINMTNHSYFNISGDPTSITGTKITLSTDDYLPVDDGSFMLSPKQDLHFADMIVRWNSQWPNYVIQGCQEKRELCAWSIGARYRRLLRSRQSKC